MTTEEFNKLLDETLEAIRATLGSKAEEYAIGDRLYNFKRAAEMARCTPAQALKGMLLKHLVSIFDLIEGNLENTEAMVNEKVGDGINYLILLKAVLQEARTRNLKLVSEKKGYRLLNLYERWRAGDEYLDPETRAWVLILSPGDAPKSTVIRRKM